MWLRWGLLQLRRIWMLLSMADDGVGAKFSWRRKVSDAAPMGDAMVRIAA